MDELIRILDRFDGLRVLVAGDLMVDEHVWGTTSRVSPEAPVLVVDVNGEPELRPGGAANVVNNVRALGGSAAVVGVVGSDSFGAELQRQLSSAGVDTYGIVVDPTRVTTRKTRIWVSHRQQIVRVDRECKSPLDESTAERIVSLVSAALPKCDALILSDYNKGVLNTSVAARVVQLARDMNRICAANPKPANLSGFKGAGLVVLNQSEAEAAALAKLDCEEAVMAVGKAMLSDLQVACLVITRGTLGLTIFEPTSARTIAAVPLEVYDVAGAGDTVISALTLALAAGAAPLEAARIANLAGGAAVRKVGVSAVTRDEIVALAAISGGSGC